MKRKLIFVFFFFLVGDVWLFNHNGSPILVCNWLKLFHIINQIDKNKKKAWIVWKKGMYIAIGFGEGRWCRIGQKREKKATLSLTKMWSPFVHVALSVYFIAFTHQFPPKYTKSSVQKDILFCHSTIKNVHKDSNPPKYSIFQLV